MSTRFSIRTCAALALLASTATAQGPSSTGVLLTGNTDNAWQVAFNSGPFASANIVTSPPGVWAANVPGTYQWISVLTSGSLGIGGTSYLYRTTFDLTGYDPTSATLAFRYAVDNGDSGYSLNGGPSFFGAGGGFQFGNVQTVTSGFVGGVNTLTFAVTGDAITDGLLVDVQRFSAKPLATTTPEPATFALVAGGLALVGVAARRRRA